MSTRGWMLAAGALAGAMALAGCLERVETIRVSPDGSVSLRSEFTGDPGDFGDGDALPAPGGAWAVTDETVEKEGGKKEQHRVATLDVAPGGAIPDSYAPPDAGRAYELSLRFPTTLVVAHDVGGTYMNFQRVYARRTWARFDYWRRPLEKDDKLKALASKEPETLTDEDRAALVDAMKRAETGKHLEFIDAACAAMRDAWALRTGLEVRRAVVEYARGFDLRPATLILAQPPSTGRDEAVERLAAEYVAGFRGAAVRAMSDLAVPPDQRALFLDAYDREEKRLAITEDLSDERWVVRVALPGRIITHNGDRVEGSTIVWEFDASAIMDRDQTLQAVSRLDDR